MTDMIKYKDAIDSLAFKIVRKNMFSEGFPLSRIENVT